MRVSEQFGPVIQGEGPSAGFPAYFIRVPDCNLMCGGIDAKWVKEGRATWHCDSEKQWKQATEKTFEQIVQEISDAGALDNVLLGNTHLVITGGEPALSIDNIKGLINYIYQKYPAANLYTELETNGSVLIDGYDLDEYFTQVNCSVKLANSGNSAKARINPAMLKNINQHKNSCFKLVVSAKEDYDAAVADFSEFINFQKVMLMPAGHNEALLAETFPIAWEIACEHNLRLSGRLQIWAFGEMTGV